MRGIAVVLCMGCGLWISACARVAPEQPRTLMRAVAATCAERFADIDIMEVTPYGHLVIGYGVIGQSHRREFLACYRTGVHDAIRAHMAAGHLASSAAVGAHTTVPITLVGERLVVPVTLNRTQQVSLVLDPQASHTILRPAVMERSGLSVPSNARRWTVTFLGRPPISIPLAPVSSLAVGGLAVEDLDVGSHDAFPHTPGVAGVLGGDVLDSCRLTVERGSQQLTLEVRQLTRPPKAYPVQQRPDVD